MRGSMHPIAMMIQKPSSAPNIEIMDSEAMAIDRAIGKLRRHRLEFWNAVIAFYRYRQNYTQVAEYLNVDRRRANTIVKAATAWIEGALIMNRAA